MGNKSHSALKSHVIILWLVLLCSVTSAQNQNPVRVMRIHYNDGAVTETPVSMIDSITFDYNTGNTYVDSITSNEVLQRAYRMASFEWTPLKAVPKRGGGYYPPDVTVTGVPYSSVKELNTYLFQDVSYHTFMTAVHSPMSVLYTEDISQPPYHGTNCAPYYGAVCSSSVMWALGFDLPYSSGKIIQLPDFTMNESQEIDSLKICDVIWKTSHMQMIYDMEYREDTLYRITTFETSGSNSHLKKYTKAQFQNMWNTNGYVGYRYNRLKYSTEPLIILDWDSIAYNNYLCPSKGDKAVYRATDTVTIHIYDSNYSQIVLIKDASLVALDSNNGYMQQYYGLTPGIYTVCLQNGNVRSAKASFEIIETNVSYEWSSDGNNVIIYFDSSVKPEYAALCRLSGGSWYYKISEADLRRGYIMVPRLQNEPEYYCKVLFRGEYGRIINVPIRVE